MKQVWTAIALLSASLAGCSAGSDVVTAATPVSAATAPGVQRTVTGRFVKGPVLNASYKVVNSSAAALDCTQAAIPGTSCSATPGTSDFSCGVPAAGGFAICATGGEFVDETDPAEPPASARRTISLGAGSLGLSFNPELPADQFSLNTYTLALQVEAERLRAAKSGSCNVTVGHALQAVDAAGQQAVGNVFHPRAFPPDPLNPGAVAADRSYGMLLGGIAMGINEAAGRSGRSQMDLTTINALTQDLSDGVMDGKRRGADIPLTGAPGNILPAPLLALNSQIARFRDNNDARYAGTAPLSFNSTPINALNAVNLGPTAGVSPTQITTLRSLAPITRGGTVAIPVSPCDPEGNLPLSSTLEVVMAPTQGSLGFAAGVVTYQHNFNLPQDADDIVDTDLMAFAFRDSGGRLGEIFPVLIPVQDTIGSPKPGLNIGVDDDGDGLADPADFNDELIDTDLDGVNDFIEATAGTDMKTADSNVFYVRPGGSNTNSGTSRSQAWQNNIRVSAALSGTLPAGVHYVLYEAGAEYGPLALGGSSPNMIVLVGDQDFSFATAGSVPGFATSEFAGSNSGPLGTRAITLSNTATAGLHIYGLRLHGGELFVSENGAGLELPAFGAGSKSFRMEVTQFDNNSTQLFGGGLYVNPGWTVEMVNSNFAGNLASNGGAIYMVQSVLTAVDTDFGQNVSAGSGGAIAADDNSSVSLIRSRFAQNQTGQSGSGCAGGAMYARDSAVFVDDSVFSRNSAICDAPCSGCALGGGALYLTDSVLGASAPTILNSRFLSNQVTGSTPDAFGGALFVDNVASVAITNNLFVGNVSGTEGGAIALSGAPVAPAFYHLDLNTLAYNQALSTADGAGGGLLSNVGGNGVASADNIFFFNDNGTIGAAHTAGEDCKATGSFGSGFNTVGNAVGCGSGPTISTASPAFIKNFYLTQSAASSAFDTGSAGADRADGSYLCATLGLCIADYPLLTTDAAGLADAGTLDRGYHHVTAAGAVANGAIFPPPGLPGATASCTLPVSFIPQASGTEIGEGHRIGVCIDNSNLVSGITYSVAGLGTLDPVNNDGATPASCGGRAALAYDSGINSIYSIDVTLTLNGLIALPFNLRIFPNDGASFTIPISTSFQGCS